MSSHKIQGKGGEFARGFFTPFVLDRVMRRVLHVGPCDTPGGMATVMQTLAEFPLKAGRRICWPPMPRVVCGQNGEPTGGLGANSNDDAATPRFDPMWFMCTLQPIGRGEEKDSSITCT